MKTKANNSTHTNHFFKNSVFLLSGILIGASVFLLTQASYTVQTNIDNAVQVIKRIVLQMPNGVDTGSILSGDTINTVNMQSTRYCNKAGDHCVDVADLLTGYTETDPVFILHSGDYLTGEIWADSGTDVFYTGGNVGIGTSTPDYKLQVSGDIVPETSNVSSLGINGLRWDIYANDIDSDTIKTQSIMSKAINTTGPITGTTIATPGVTIGGGIVSAINLNASSQVNADTVNADNILPIAALNTNIGVLADRWTNMYTVNLNSSNLITANSINATHVKTETLTATSKLTVPVKSYGISFPCSTLGELYLEEGQLNLSPGTLYVCVNTITNTRVALN